MRTFGLIGFPLEHSFSPGYFSEKFFREGIGDAEYKLFPLDQIEDLEQLLDLGRILRRLCRDWAHDPDQRPRPERDEHPRPRLERLLSAVGEPAIERDRNRDVDELLGARLSGLSHVAGSVGRAAPLSQAARATTRDHASAPRSRSTRSIFLEISCAHARS